MNYVMQKRRLPDAATTAQANRVLSASDCAQVVRLRNHLFCVPNEDRPSARAAWGGEAFP